jgi:hypothetical protein
MAGDRRVRRSVFAPLRAFSDQAALAFLAWPARVTLTRTEAVRVMVNVARSVAERLSERPESFSVRTTAAATAGETGVTGGAVTCGVSGVAVATGVGVATGVEVGVGDRLRDRVDVRDGGGGVRAPAGHGDRRERFDRIGGGDQIGLQLRGRHVGSAASASAASPATCGAAIDVPCRDTYPPPAHSDRICTPGANRSTVVWP